MSSKMNHLKNSPLPSRSYWALHALACNYLHLERKSKVYNVKFPDTEIGRQTEKRFNKILERTRREMEEREKLDRCNLDHNHHGISL